ncbi:MAG: hypothetical protein RLZZ528_2393 [Pseudomonadota bacterium]
MARPGKLIVILAGLFLACTFAFMTGFTFRHYSIWPTRDALTLVRQAKVFARTGVWGKENQYLDAAVSGDMPRAVIHDPAAFLPGYRVILAYDAGRATYAAHLLDAQARELHVWPVNYGVIAAEGEETDINPHGMEVLPDGSLVVNFAEGSSATARLDACGHPMWTARGVYHHSFHRDDDGNLWTWFSPDHIASNLQSVVKLDVDSGAVLKSISMQDVVKAWPDNARLLRLPQDFPFTTMEKTRKTEIDTFHPNDVEPLLAGMAAEYPMFEAGDLLISLRNLDLVAVLDPETLRFRWVQYGPWRQQHDPDFIGGGLIDIYNNNPGHGRSNLVTIDPATNLTVERWTTDDSRFYSDGQGKQQRLPNGAHLVAVPAEGRAVEISPDGRKVFEYNNVAGGGVNAIVLNAAWLPPDYFTKLPHCTDKLAARSAQP